MHPLHGGDTTGFRLARGRDPLDFSASLNPFGIHPAARAAAHAALDAAPAYPDPRNRALAAALAARLGVPGDYLLFGNGAADLIHRFAQAAQPKTALLPAPAFAEYERAVAAAGGRTERHPLRREDNFDLTESILPKITRSTDVLFLCQPNNPTSRAVAPSLLRKILARCAETGTRLFLDECFRAFLDEPAAHSLLPFLRDFPNLILLDSFTKLHGMAGLRLGYAASADTALLRTMQAIGQPWPVSSVAQAAGLAALREDAAEENFIADSLREIRAAKRKLLAALERFPTEILTVLGADANFLFFFSPVPELDERLAREGILIRNCANFPGLAAGYCRIAVRREEENAVLLAALQKILLEENPHQEHISS